jgi:hypothetical protein
MVTKEFMQRCHLVCTAMTAGAEAAAALWASDLAKQKFAQVRTQGMHHAEVICSKCYVMLWVMTGKGPGR